MAKTRSFNQFNSAEGTFIVGKFGFTLAAVSTLSLALTGQTAGATSLFTSKASFQAAAPTSIVIEDFEGISAGLMNTQLPSLTRASGTYVGYAGVPFHNVYVSSPGYNNYGPGLNPTTSSILTANGDEDFIGTLAIPAYALGFDVYGNDLGTAMINFYNGANLLGSIQILADIDSSNNFSFAGISNAGPVTSFRFTSTAGGQLNTGIDNILAAPISGAVPEPASWAMMIGGLALVGAAMRRRATSVQFA
jgi:hypothetical protein